MIRSKLLPSLPSVLCIALTASSRADIYYSFDGALNGEQMVPPTSSPGSMTVSGQCDGSSTVTIEIEFRDLVGAPSELRLYTYDRGSERLEGTLLEGSQIVDGTRQEIDPPGDGDCSYWTSLVLTTTAFPDGELRGALAVNGVWESCGQFSERGDCWEFLSYEFGFLPMVGDPSFPINETVRVRGQMISGELPCWGTHVRYFVVDEITDCQPVDLGCGRFVREPLDGCHLWITDQGSFYFWDDAAWSSGDSLHVWGVPGWCDNVCLLGAQCIYGDIRVESCGDTLSPTIDTSWGQVKRHFH